MKSTAVLLPSTPMRLARKGSLAAISQFLIEHNGSILHRDDHLDSGRDFERGVKLIGATSHLRHAWPG